jgi:hypothetical protein
MNHIYAVQRPEVAKKRSREIITDNIRFLRSFEMKHGQSRLIDEKIAQNVEKLHGLWFGKDPSANTSKQ